MNLQTINKILLFGKSRAFSEEEFISQLKHHKIELVKEYTAEVSLVVDGRMMTPYEQNLSDALYEKESINAVSIDVLEKELATFMDEGTLLMSLKLSRDKERLKSFIQNTLLQDSLFFKLMKMYSWRGEDFFENDDNRDVSAAFISRFYENIERNHNVQYATTGFIHLVGQTKSSELLKAIASLEPLKFHPKIMAAILRSEFCDANMQEQFARKDEQEIDEALSCNKNLKLSIVEKFLKRGELARSMAQNISLSEESFKLLFEFKEDLARNESLSEEMQKELLSLEKIELYRALACNENLRAFAIKRLLENSDTELFENLYKNSKIPVNLLEEAYKKGLYLGAIAQNEATPVEILYQLQLDSRYERFVKTNAAFGRHIQSENIGWL
jgi:hypothetical protein